MSRTIGVDITSLRKIFKERKDDAEQRLLSGLPPHLSDVYSKTLAADWVDIPLVSELYSHVVKILYPGQSGAYFLLGKDLADKSYSGFLKIFLLFPTVKYLISRAANIWRNYHEKGAAVIENEEAKSCDYVVRDFTDLPKTFRDITKGHIFVLLEKTGAKNIKIDIDETNPSAWRWKVSWE